MNRSHRYSWAEPATGSTPIIVQSGRMEQYRSIIREGIEANAVELDVLGPHEEVVPARRIEKVDSRDFNVGRIVG